MQCNRQIKIEWGRIHFDSTSVLRDAMIYPDGAIEWDWRKSNTHHVPGIQIQDVEFLLEKGCEEIVLSRGMQLALQTDAATIEFLKTAGIPFIIEESTKAVIHVNQLRGDGGKVGALLHSTC